MKMMMMMILLTLPWEETKSGSADWMNRPLYRMQPGLPLMRKVMHANQPQLRTPLNYFNYKWSTQNLLLSRTILSLRFSLTSSMQASQLMQDQVQNKGQGQGQVSTLGCDNLWNLWVSCPTIPVR